MPVTEIYKGQTVLTEPVPGAGGAAINTALKNLLDVSFREFFADQMDLPVNADFAVNAVAPSAADSNNAALKVSLFDDTVEEGVVMPTKVPDNAIGLIVRLISRAETAPGAAQNVIPKLYGRSVPDNAAVPAWSAGQVMAAVALPTNENFQYDEEEFTLAALGLVAGKDCQIELTRDATNVSDDLVGDWALLKVELQWVFAV